MHGATITRAARLLGLSARELADLIAAQVALLRAQWLLRVRPVGSLVRRAALAPGGPSGDAARAQQLALAVGRAAEHGVFRPRCLARSIALRDLLASHGIEGSVIRVGVQQERGRFLAHAWVTWRDQVLGDRAEWVARFTEVDDLNVLRNA